MLLQPLNFLNITGDYNQSHKAIDLGWSREHGGTVPPVFALADGVVEKVYKTETGGNCLRINYGEYTSVYKHLKKIFVKEAQMVAQGEKVAQMGATGSAATGNHLHFELYKDDEVVIPYEHFYYDENAIIGPRKANAKLRPVPKPLFEVGDKVKIVAYGNSQASGNGKTARGIGYKRVIKAIYDGEPFPYKVGNAFGTTGFYSKEGIEKI